MDVCKEAVWSEVDLEKQPLVLFNRVDLNLLLNDLLRSSASKCINVLLIKGRESDSRSSHVQLRDELPLVLSWIVSLTELTVVSHK